MNATLNIILTRFRQFVDNHYILQRFSFGQIDTVDLDKFGSYPLLHVVPGQESIDTVCTWSFDIYILDKPRDKDEHSKQDYQKHVLSDTAQCMRDLIADITNGGNVFAYSENWSVNVAVPAQYITQAFNHTLSGVFATVEISYPWGIDACDLPMLGVTPASLVCLDATVEVNGEAFDTVASGGTLEVPVEYPDGTPVGTITSGVVVIPDPTCADADVENSDQTYTDTVASGATLVLPDITITEPDDTTITWPSVKDFDVRTLKAGIAYKRPFYSQKTAYVAGDEGTNFAAGVYEFTPPPYPLYYQHLSYTASVASVYKTLAHNNIFGNTNRFTQPDGTVISGNGVGLVIVDHLTGMAWWGANQGQSTWANAFGLVTTANTAVTGGYNDWRLPTVGELYSIFNYEGTLAAFGTPFEHYSSNVLWASTTNPASTGQAMTAFSGRAISQQTKAISTNRTVLVRTFYP